MLCLIIIESIIEGEVAVVLFITQEFVRVWGGLDRRLSGLGAMLSACGSAVKLNGDLPIWRQVDL
jgi:hypothetical protein